MDNARKGSQLRDWLESNGGYLQETIDIAHDEQHGYHLRASQDVDNSIPVIHVPLSLTLSVSTLSHARSRWPKKFITDHLLTKPFLITRFLLMDEYLYSGDSWWYPYIALLPQPRHSGQWPSPFSTPLWFSEEDTKWLRGTGLQKATEQMRDSWQAEYNTGIKYLGLLPNHNRFTWLLYLWAATVISSRCFPNDRYMTQQDSSPPAVGGEKETAWYPVLVPVLDLANHDPRVEMKCHINQEGYSLFLAARVLRNHQIYITYGDKSNDELFMGYGFVLQDNPADLLGLYFPIPEAPRKWCMVQAITEGKHHPLFMNDVPRDSLDKSTERGLGQADDMFYLKIGSRPPASLVDTLRLNVANERELKDFYHEKDQSANRSLIQAYAQLALALLRGVTLLSTSPAASEQTAPTANQLVARTHAFGQKQIFVHHTQKLITDLKRVRRSPVMWSLQDVLDSSNIHPIKTGMRRLCRAVCSTRSHIKLRSQGFEDSIMTIFICLLWLATPRNQQVSQSEMVEGNDIHALFLQWCSFLDSTYCPPPGKDSSCIGVNCLCPLHIPHPWTLSELENGNAPAGDVTAAAHAIVHRAFLLDDIDPLFGESENWTERFLRWGYGVWTAEAVLMPVLPVNSTETPPENSTDHLFDICDVDDIRTEKVLYLEMLSSNARAIDPRHG